MKRKVFAVWYGRIVPAALALTFVVVVLGAWVRLSDAGLGCPDWPGCYGTLTVPNEAAELAHAETRYPAFPVETAKAWKEMIHRYAAALLGLLVIAIAACAWGNRRDPGQPVALPIGLVALIVGQGLLGMLTVTWLLKPVIVMLHLLGGMTTLGILGWLAFGLRRPARRIAPPHAALRRLGLIALAAVALQIALGGWTSTNYAALACPDFPTCQTQWWPQMNFRDGFVLWHGLGVNYEGGILDNEARTAIHVVHRIGAAVLTALLTALLIAVWRRDSRARGAALFTGAALAAQLSIGVAIVLLSLPLWLATAHNATAALLLLAVLNLNHALRHARD